MDKRDVIEKTHSKTNYYWIGLVCFIMGLFIGYLWGYQAGIRETVEYAIKLVDKIKIDKVEVLLNGTTIDSILKNINNITSELNKRMNNISLT
jgi:hypothetical protein